MLFVTRTGIVIGSLALTLVVFFSGFIIGWLRQRYQSWRRQEADASGGVEFSRLDSLVSTDVEI